MAMIVVVVAMADYAALARTALVGTRWARAPSVLVDRLYPRRQTNLVSLEMEHIDKLLEDFRVYMGLRGAALCPPQGPHGPPGRAVRADGPKQAGRSQRRRLGASSGAGEGCMAEADPTEV